MKLNLSAILILPVLFILNFSIAAAQTWEVGGFLGTSGYMGDLNPINPFHISNIAFGGQVKRNFDPYWSLKFNVAHGTIEAADADSENEYYRSRNLSFFSPVTELSLQTEFNFFKFIPSISSRRYTPYLFAGLGFVAFNPKAIYEDKVYELALLGTEGQDPANSYKTMALAIPYGAGVKYNFAGKWNLTAELGYRNAYTDYLDDVSGKYAANDMAVSLDRFILSDRSPEVGFLRHTPGTQRGDSRNKDTYLFLGITISYTIFNYKCPVVEQ